MKNKYVIAIAIVALVAGAVFAAQAIGGPNSKSAFAGSRTVISHSNASGEIVEHQIGDAVIRVSEKSDLVISLTAVSNLFTDTTVKGNTAGNAVGETSTAGITVWAKAIPLNNDGTNAEAAAPINAFPEEALGQYY